MRRCWLALCLLLTPMSAASANEIDGLGSRSIDISSGYTAERGEYAAAFTSFDGADRPTHIVVQSRFTDVYFDTWIACSRPVELPPSAHHVSHPALSTSGWLFVSASSASNAEAPEGWRLWAMRRGPVYPGLGSTPCSGWETGWIDLGRFPSSPSQLPPRPVRSAPDAVVVYDTFTFVFVTDRDGRVDYRFARPAPVSAGRGAPPVWSDWLSLDATDPARKGYLRAYSKPAAAVYNDRIHLFWHDASHGGIHHVRAQVGITGRLSEDRPDWRAFGDHIGVTTARTACSAGPEIRTPSPLFIVCGNARGTGSTSYSIARYLNPARPWGAPDAVQTVAGRPWISRTAYGGFSAPSLGRTGLPGKPFMFLTFGTRYCPQPGRGGVPAASCLQPPARWAIQNRWSSPANHLSEWEPLNYAIPARAGPLE